MVDIRPFMNKKLHVVVSLTGQCKKCKKSYKERIYDYGILPFAELEKQMDKTSHVLKEVDCKYCNTKNKPEHLIYEDLLRNVVISKVTINYGNEIDSEKSKEMMWGHENRFEIFKEKENEFWDDYTNEALVKWRDFINELNDFEIKDAYQKMNIDTNANTVNQLRKEVLTKFKTVKEKQEFWRYANEYFIYEHLLEIGAMGWHIEADIKTYGINRMRFVILHFPLHESYETLRTEWIGSIIKKNKGDNDFLFRRIAMITDELNRVRKKLNDAIHKIEVLKIEKSELESKLSKSYNEIREFKEQVKTLNVKRDPRDIQKIHELKSFIAELIDELKEKQRIIEELQPKQKENEDVFLEEDEIEGNNKNNNIEKLKGKTVFIVGGNRQKQANKEYPCKVITHEGSISDPDFYRMLRQADIIAVITQFVSHAVMWETRSYAIENDTPIYYVRGLNITKILSEISEK